MPRRDDSFLDRFEGSEVRHARARDAVVAIAVVALILVVLAGGAVSSAADRLSPGIGRDVIAAVGVPAGWIADRLPFDDAQRKLTAGLSPDSELIGEGFETATVSATDAEAPSPQALAPITADAFDPGELGLETGPRPELTKLLVTGDSMSKPLDEELARRLSADGVETIRDPYLGSGITIPEIVDWARVSTTQAEEHEPDAVVMFLGAGDSYPLPGPGGELLECCGPDWAAAYASRARQMMDTYRREGATRVYWLTIPAARNPDRDQVTRAVNAALDVAAQPWRSQIRVVDLIPALTPGGEYSDSLEIDGSERLVRASDGIHLNEAGASLAADVVLEVIERDFTR